MVYILHSAWGRFAGRIGSSQVTNWHIHSTEAGSQSQKHLPSCHIETGLAHLGSGLGMSVQWAGGSTGFSEVRESPQEVQLHKELPCWLTSGGSGGNHTSKVMSTGVTPHLWRYCVTQLQDEESRNATDESPFHPLQCARTESSWGGNMLPAFLPLPKRLGICC